MMVIGDEPAVFLSQEFYSRTIAPSLEGRGRKTGRILKSEIFWTRGVALNVDERFAVDEADIMPTQFDSKRHKVYQAISLSWS
ncbi:hypothetical protein [Glaciimonas immobilis]|uniref:Uncharacterized protein n=1 Tax=Glaciimonas immobilis TaxID=728004 RepID=A0A840RUX1_9BURK|nr:hypothetical protein [Glaciimonas immobilis]KAF3998559.1 hypothetical protein HAV38_06810 [Glaciimonas immobilis]MBB5201413.1 hypothetical protein [Glaciimonas immobilis]